MREILGRQRRTRSALLTAALTYAEQWHWPVLPGAVVQPRRLRDRFGDRLGNRLEERREGRRTSRPCECPSADCTVPGAHPYDPPLLAATTDRRMVRWWWTQRPDAPIVAATGDTLSAVSLPATAGARVLDYFDALRVRVGPVAASPTRYVLLVAPYTFDELGELLQQQEWVPSSLRYHGPGGYVVLPPSRIGSGQVHWERPPMPDAAGAGTPWLPEVSDLVGALVAASTATPDGNRLAF